MDGQSKPAISGALDELCRAAEASGARFVPLPAFTNKGAFNFYLPIFFTRGIRIEIEATDEIEEFYTQIDYRTEARPQPSPRLVSEKNEAGLTLNYSGDRAHSIPRKPRPIVLRGRAKAWNMDRAGTPENSQLMDQEPYAN